jgi:hypothetical protein
MTDTVVTIVENVIDLTVQQQASTLIVQPAETTTVVVTPQETVSSALTETEVSVNVTQENLVLDIKPQVLDIHTSLAIPTLSASGVVIEPLEGVTATNVQEALQELTAKTWAAYVFEWAQEPTLVSTSTSGDIYEYTFENNLTLYRLVPTPYSPQQDAFYTDIDLTDLVVSRGN